MSGGPAIEITEETIERAGLLEGNCNRIVALLAQLKDAYDVVSEGSSEWEDLSWFRKRLLAKLRENRKMLEEIDAAIEQAIKEAESPLVKPQGLVLPETAK